MPPFSPIHQRVARPLPSVPTEPVVPTSTPVSAPSVPAPATTSPAATVEAAATIETAAPSPATALGGRQLWYELGQQALRRFEGFRPGQGGAAATTSPATIATSAATAPAEATAPPPPAVGERIARGARAYRGTSTRRGPGGGNLACAYAVNNVLRQQGIRPLGQNTNYVPSMEQDLQQRVRQGTAVRVPPGQARPGDIVIASNQSHVGIALGGGRVLSNSSSRRSFSWESGMNFDGFYGGGASRVYRLVK